MPIAINNTVRNTSIIRVVDPGTYYVNVSDLSANSSLETVNSFDIKRVYWSTNGNINLVRNGNIIFSVHNAGEFRLDDLGYTFANNNTQNAVITIVTGGTLIMELSKEAVYSSDPYAR
jgi:hypothetical protein